MKTRTKNVRRTYMITLSDAACMAIDQMAEQSIRGNQSKWKNDVAEEILDATSGAMEVSEGKSRMININDYISELQHDGKYVVVVVEKADFDFAVKKLKKAGDIPKDYKADYPGLADDLEQALWDTTFGESSIMGQLKSCIEADAGN